MLSNESVFYYTEGTQRGESSKCWRQDSFVKEVYRVSQSEKIYIMDLYCITLHSVATDQYCAAILTALHFGFWSQGDSIQTCQGDGTWSGTPPVCVGRFVYTRGTNQEISLKVTNT